MIKKTPTEEAFSEIRNAYVSMCGIVRRVAKKNLTDSQGWIEIAKQLRRQRDYFQMIKENL
jgi:hypothetical protein